MRTKLEVRIVDRVLFSEEIEIEGERAISPGTAFDFPESEGSAEDLSRRLAYVARGIASALENEDSDLRLGIEKGFASEKGEK